MNMLHMYSVFLLTVIQFLHLHCFNLDIAHTIIYEDPSKSTGKRGSYFGFSLLLYSGSNQTKPWIQIGAPRGNDTYMYKGVKEPGVVYRCPILEPCKTVKFDKISSGTQITETIAGKRHYYIDGKNGAWIGGAMDIDEKNGRVAVCAHRWGYEKRVDQLFYMLGACYWSNVENDISSSSGVFKLIPLHQPDNYFHAYGNNPYYILNYGLGQAGISVHFPKYKENPELLIGAPGVSNWKGSAVLYKAKDSNRHKNYTSYNVVDPKSLYVEQYTLFGYQVNSGKFGNNNKGYYYVAGNPKGSKKGKVVLFTYTQSNNVKEIKKLEGYQIGEYFGSSLAVVDINCDKVDDLIVGAPQHTEDHDEGRIYVFISNLQSTIFRSPIVIKGKIVGGRFGTTITALGDLDNDGCDDLAVGAPFANNNTGVVYIYNGDPRGPLLSQKIVANEIHPELKGFGISISRATDFDDNGYPDVAVGAFMSDQTVIFRAKPVISLGTNITASVAELDEDIKSFNITVCLSYSGNSEYIPETLRVSATVIVDEELGRAYFANKQKSHTVYVIIKNKKHCEHIEVFLLKATLKENEFDPVTIKVTQKLADSEGNATTVVIGSDSSIKRNDGFMKDFPVINKQNSSQSAVLNIPFVNECGDGNECEAELQLNSSFIGITNGQYIIGSDSKVKLQVNVTNKKQSAYRTEVHIIIPSPIQLSSGDKNCREISTGQSLQLYCNFGNPLRNGTLRSMILNLDTQSVKPGSKNVKFYISVKTSSKDKNEGHNSQELQLSFVVDAKISLIGSSEELVYNYAKTNKTIFKHRYEVRKWGSSPIYVVEVKLNIPIKLNRPASTTSFLDLYRPKAYLAGQELSCSPEESFVYHIDENVQNFESAGIPVSGNSTRSKREALENEFQLPINATLFLNCSVPYVKCIKIRCYAGPFDSHSKISASIELKMKMNFTNLGQAVAENTTIYFSTEGSVSIKEPNITEFSQRINNAIINTTFTSSPHAEASVQVPTWIIALSIIAGIFILMLIVIGFMKAGFFERKKKEELKSLMAIYTTNVFTVGKAPGTIRTMDNNDGDKEVDNDDDDDDDEDDDEEEECNSHDDLK